MLQASRPNNKPFCWNCVEDDLFFFPLPKTPSICIFLSSFLFLLQFFLRYCKGRSKSSRLQTVTYYDFSVWLRIMFSFPLFTLGWFANSFRHKASLFFPDVGLNVKLKIGRSQESNCLSSHTGTKSFSLPFGPCTFFFSSFLQRGQPWHWDLGLREQKTRDRLPHCVLWGWFLLTQLG